MSVVKKLFVVVLMAAVGVTVIGCNDIDTQSVPAATESSVLEATSQHEAISEYGRRLLRETAALIGPGNPDPEMRYSGNQLACASCHMDIGATPGTLSLLPTASRYPGDSARDGGMRDLQDRINGCMERSMNGRMFPRDSVEMIAMETYINDLGVQYDAMTESQRTAVEPEKFKEPDRAANVEAGRVVYQERCVVCHGAEGLGLQIAASAGGAYIFPPLWGPDSYNNGAGMTRVLTAANFIKAKMPLGLPNLTDDQAYDVSAFVNSHERPTKPNLEVDFPDKARKPVDSPYPPYADPFPQEQHILGPFKPIREYYENLKKESPAADDAR